MDVAAISVEAEAADHHFAPIGSAIAVAVFELPNVGMGCRVHRAIMPENALGEDEFIREQSALVEVSVAVNVFQSGDASKLLLDQFRARHIEPRPFGHV